jgi:hypothetical protein
MFGGTEAAYVPPPIKAAKDAVIFRHV